MGRLNWGREIRISCILAFIVTLIMGFLFFIGHLHTYAFLSTELLIIFLISLIGMLIIRCTLVIGGHTWGTAALISACLSLLVTIAMSITVEIPLTFTPVLLLMSVGFFFIFLLSVSHRLMRLW